MDKAAEARGLRDDLEFIVALANQDLDCLRPSRWMDLRERFDDFFAGDRTRNVTALGGYIPVSPSSARRKLTDDDFRELQKYLKDFLDRHVSFRDRQKKDAPVNPPASIKDEFKFSTLPVVPGIDVTLVEGPPASVFRFIVMQLMNRPEANQLKACPECGKFFVRTRRQKYCDTPCTNAASKRAFVERGEAKKKKGARHAKKR